MHISIKERAIVLGLGFGLAAALASSMMAVVFRWDAALGPPVHGFFYSPLAIWRWWEAWGGLEPFTTTFKGGLFLVVLPAFLTFLGWILVRSSMARELSRQDPNEGLGTIEQLAAAEGIAKEGDGIVIGLKRGWWPGTGDVLRETNPGHVLVMGKPRSGKDVAYITTTIMEAAHKSLVIFDPKREQRKRTERDRQRVGPTNCFDPTVRWSSCFNPLLEMRLGEHLIGDALMVGRVMAPRKGKDPTWDDAAMFIVAGAAAQARLSDDPTLGHVWRIIMEVIKGNFPTPLCGFVDDVWMAHAALDARVRTSVEFSVKTHLQALADPLVQRATCTSDFRAADVMCSEDPMTLYLNTPSADADRLQPVMRVVLELLMKPLLRDLKKAQDGQPKKRDCTVIANEFTRLGEMPLFERDASESPGYGIRFMFVCQDLSQIKKVYGQYQGITGLCGTHIIIPGFNRDTIQEVASWAGSMVSKNHSQSRQPFGMKALLPSTSEAEAMRAVLDGRRMLLRKRQALVFTSDTEVEPTWVPQARFFNLRRYKGRWDEVD